MFPFAKFSNNIKKNFARIKESFFEGHLTFFLHLAIFLETKKTLFSVPFRGRASLPTDLVVPVVTFWQELRTPINFPGILIERWGLKGVPLQ